jgi:hypothetical protein
MDIKETMENITVKIHGLSKKEFEKYLMLSLGAMAFLTGGMIYYIYQRSSSLVTEIRQIEKLAKKSVKISAEYEKIKEEEERLQAVLEKNKDFNMKIYFEQFCKEQSLTPESGWDTSYESINEKFDEVSISASFKKQTTEKLISVFQEIDKKEIVYVKNLRIRKEKDKTIRFDFTISTKKSK